MRAPACESTSLPPVWSQCQWVLKAVVTRRVPVTTSTVASRLRVESAAPVSTISKPSAALPMVTTLPPAPANRLISSVSLLARITGEAWTDAASPALAPAPHESVAAPAMAWRMNCLRSVKLAPVSSRRCQHVRRQEASGLHAAFIRTANPERSLGVADTNPTSIALAVGHPLFEEQHTGGVTALAINSPDHVRVT